MTQNCTYTNADENADMLRVRYVRTNVRKTVHGLLPQIHPPCGGRQSWGKPVNTGSGGEPICCGRNRQTRKNLVPVHQVLDLGSPRRGSRRDETRMEWQ